MSELIVNCKKIGKYYQDIHKVLIVQFEDQDEATFKDKMTRKAN